MQARLQPSEYAYLLHVLEAEKVVGIDNDAFFPKEPAVKQEMLHEGFTLLKTHGWFREVNGRISANNTLFLMTAVTAAPDLVLTATYIELDGTTHLITYYQAEGHTVEQFQTGAGEIMLTLLDSAADIADHLVQALALPERPSTTTLTLPLPEFKEALAAARQDNNTPLHDLLVAETELGHMAQPLARAIGSLRPAGRVEGAAIKHIEVEGWGEIGLLRDQTKQLWLAVQNPLEEMIVLVQASADSFTAHLTRLIDSLWAVAPLP